MKGSMKGTYLPGNSTVELREVEVPTPGYGQVLIKVKSSTICGSDIRAIYRQHLGEGPERYQNKIVGHEPAGQIVECGAGMRRFGVGDRVAVYHISGCGLCNDCRRGYMISCTSPLRAAYGWQRDGAMARFLLAEERDLISLPDSLTYTDGAQVACGFGTVYEALQRVGVSGDNNLLVVGLGPVGLAALKLGRGMGANKLIGVDAVRERCDIAKDKRLADHVLGSGRATLEMIRELTNGKGVERAIDCSGNTYGRQLAIRATRKWGKIAMVGEGGSVELNPSVDIIHEQKAIYGSWVTSIWLMEDLIEALVRWGIHPEDLVTHRFTIENVSEAYSTMDMGKSGKVAVVFDEEIK